MNLLGFDAGQLSQRGAAQTAREICQQPAVWKKISENFRAESAALNRFLDEALATCTRIVLTGAGTSAYIGLSLRGLWQRRTGLVTEALATTDIVTHPDDYFHDRLPTLLISFARSGNSPESKAALRLAEERTTQCFHLVITCNAEGQLATASSACRKYIFVLPEEANDESLVMTSSYSGMLLAGILAANLRSAEPVDQDLRRISRYAEKILHEFAPVIREICESDFRRVFFLGSGCLYGTATESHLKLQEMTDGKIICQHDSYLGFRHGPKAVVDGSTLLVYFLSGRNDVNRYESDLIDSNKRISPLLTLAISESKETPGVSADYIFSPGGGGDRVSGDEYLAVCFVLFGQLLGFYKSLQLGVRPDQPSESGAITRVVEGVRIY